MSHIQPIPVDTEQFAHDIIGCAIRVHRELGPGFLEHLYRRALCVEFVASGLPFESEKAVSVGYRGRTIRIQRLDFVVGGRVLLELKAVTTLEGVHKAQVLSYLKASGIRLGLLINFNVAVLKNGISRIAL